MKDVPQKMEQLALTLLEGVDAACKALYNHWIVLTLVTLVGLILIQLRSVALESVPWAQKNVGIITDSVDLFLLIFTAMEDIIRIIIEAVATLIHLLFPNRPKPHLAMKTYHKITDMTVKSDLSIFAATCPKFGSGGEVTQQLLRYTTQNNLCPVVRALEVTPLQNASNTLFGWMVFDPDPYATDSCKPDVSASIEWTCIGAGVGFLIVEIVVPVWVALLVLPKFLPAVQEIFALLSNVL